MVGGTVTSPLPSPAPCAMRASICSTKSGFPSADDVIRSRSSSGRFPPASKLSISVSESDSESGSSKIVVAFSLPPPQPERVSSSSGRATHNRRMPASRLQSAM